MTTRNPAAERRADLRWIRANVAVVSEPGTALRDRIVPDGHRAAHAPSPHAQLARALDVADAPLEGLTADLTGLPSVASLSASLAAALPMDAADLFRMLSFLVGASAMLDRLGGLSGLPALDDVPSASEVGAWVLDLAPSRTATRAIVLDRWAPGLDRARADARAAREEAVRARAGRVDALVAVHGVRPSARGEVVVANDAPNAAAIEADATLEVVTRTHRETIYRLRPTSAEAVAAEARAELERREADGLRALSTVFAQRVVALDALERAVARVDVAVALVRMRRAWDGCWAEPGDALRIEDARHPRVEERLRAQGRRFVPITFELGAGPACIAGPNMGGKSVVLETVLFAVALAACEVPIPARSCRMPAFDHVAWIGAESEDQAAGLSSFATEVTALVRALHVEGAAGERTLLLIDEFGRGTNPAEGAALAQALVDRLAAERRPSVLATHFALKIPVCGQAWRIRGLDGVDDADLVPPVDGSEWIDALAGQMDYRLVRTPPSSIPKDALRIAALAGLPAAWVDAAREAMVEPALESRAGAYAASYDTPQEGSPSSGGSRDE